MIAQDNRRAVHKILDSKQLANIGERLTLGVGLLTLYQDLEDRNMFRKFKFHEQNLKEV